ncbi:hypothetical protein BGZ72_005414 [Mortierella alpina]|nr:hypothetical protein BGZ72_005414 [Mortierella alpina]
MSRRALRGSASSTRQGSRDNSDNSDEENAAFLSYSTPVSKRQHRQQHHDIETRASDEQHSHSAVTHTTSHHSSHSTHSTHSTHSSNTITTPEHLPSNSSNTSNTSNTSNYYPMHHREPSSLSTVSSSSTAGLLASIGHRPSASAGNQDDDEIETATLVSSALDPLSVPVSGSSPTAAATALSVPAAAAYSKWSTIGHQLSFLATGIFSTIAVQWLYYEGAASGSSMLTVFFNYVGMICVGLVYAVQSWHADRKQRRLATTTGAGHARVEYDVLTTEVNEMTEAPTQHDDEPGVRDHIELVSNKMGISRKHMEAEAESGLRELHHHQQRHHHLRDSEDSDADSDDSDDLVVYDAAEEEKQGLRMDHPKSSFKDPSASSADLSETKSSMRLHWPVIQVAVMDVIANALVTVGFFYVGSGMYQVIYSSIVIWCAILTRIFLSRKLNNVQWVAIVGVTCGLAISAVGTVQEASPDGPVQTWLEKSFGALITLGATFLYACVYVLSDKVLSTFKPKPIPEKVCSMVGAYASLLTFIYLCVHTFPNWQTEVLDVVAAHQGSWTTIIIVYPLLTISSLLHSLNYYVLLSRINNIAVGILQSLRAVLVFVMSHYLFCSVSATQCFNQWKFVSAIVVIGCVTLFSFNSTPTTAPASAASTSTVEVRSSSVSTKPPRIIVSSSSTHASTPIPRPSSGQQRSAS